MTHGAHVDVAGPGRRWVPATNAVPALMVHALRVGLSRSPRRLVRHGRLHEAHAIVQRHLLRLLKGDLGRRTLFVCVFRACTVNPCLPTDVRSTGDGIDAAVSRVGAPSGRSCSRSASPASGSAPAG